MRGICARNAAYLPADFDPNLEETFLDLTEQYNNYFYDSSNSKNEIQNIVIEARNITDPDQAYVKFQEAIKLAKKSRNFRQQFDLACEQADRFSVVALKDDLSNDKIENIEIKWKRLSQICHSVILAIDLKLSKNLAGITNSKCESMCLILYRSAEILLSLSLTQCISRDSDKQAKMLAEAKTYQTWADKLAVQIKHEYVQHDSFSQKLSDQIKRVESKIEELKQAKLDKEKYAEEMEIIKKVYEEKFQEKLDSLAAMDKKRERIFRPRKPKIDSNVTVSKLEVNNHSTSSSDKEKSTVQVQSQPEPSSKFVFDFQEKKAALDYAIQFNDLKQLVYLNYEFSEYYKFTAERFIKYRSDASVIINHLQWAVYYIKNVANIIYNIKTGVQSGNYNYNDFKEVEEWALAHLKKTDSLLANIVTEQNDIKLRFELSRDSAKEYMTQTYGPLAWKKFNAKFNVASLSLPARILLATNNNIMVLEQMSNEVRQAEHCLQVKKENDELPVNHAVENEIPLTRPRCKSVTVCEVRQYALHTLFNARQEKVQQRSKSVESFDNIPRKSVSI